MADAGRVRRSLRSVRVRATLAATAVLIVAGVIAGVVLTSAVRDSLVDQLEETTEQRAQDLAAVVEDGTVPTELAGDADDSIAQIVDASGQVIAASANAEGRAPLVADHPRPDVVVSQTVHTPDGDGYLVVSIGVQGPDGDLVVHLASPLEPVDETVSSLVIGLVTVGPCLLALAAAVVWWVLGRALGPVESMRREVAEISIRDLSRRVAVPDSGDEIARLAETMNTMLERMDVAVERQRRFVADAAHELRSPVTAMTADLEVSIQHPSPAEELLPDLLDETRRLARIIDSLLLLARWDEGKADRSRVDVDLDDLVLDEIARAAVGTEKVVDGSGVSAGQVQGDAELLRRLVRNLLENAVRHSRSRVHVVLSEDDDGVTLVVEDDGPGIDPAQRERVFERFTRLDTARSRAEGGTGLGLAIVAEIVQRHSGTVTVTDANGGGARFEVVFPLAQQ